MTLPHICFDCKECTGNGQIYWCERESLGDVDEWLASGGDHDEKTPMPQLAVVAQLAEPPDWCPWRKETAS